MSLIQAFMADCIMLDKSRTTDGEGGFEVEWTESAPFSAALTKDTSIEARRAEKEGVTALYTVTTDRALILEYHDVFRRVSDGKVFRVTSDGTDKATPETTSLNMRQVTAEEWKLT